MAVSLKLHLLQIRRRVDLMSSAQLVVADDLGIRYSFPACSSEQMLSLDTWVTEEVIVGYHGHEIGGGHGRPGAFADGGVVYEEGGSNDAAETVPVLRRVLESWEAI